ncbi:hypothetical protein AKJ65_06175 [candidate division MSBL1 archaeon SCGC-AAA259E19]|uniref:Uncharacterized protein n=1 Tax=candidate division MSBL1 archaeon SCGC-AAA259E19 TaxID=1698264 RepID=A0A133UHD8_9EURY|nr:hypothetical protein AKJ65_06175 [candidate division MSBL1 archaeon SCGC-AAA259E19]
MIEKSNSQSVTLKPNISPPAVGDTQKSFAKKVKYWLIRWEVPIEEDDSLPAPSGHRGHRSRPVEADHLDNQKFRLECLYFQFFQH